MKIVLPGGTGQVGRLLATQFHADGHEVVVLSRKPSAADPWRVAAWNTEAVGDWAKKLDGADVVINLAGRSINCRYTPTNRKEILDSRVNSTRAVGEAIRRCANPPRVWLQASAANIYTHRYDAPNDEFTGQIDGPHTGTPDTWQFGVSVVKAWEQALNDADTPHTRRVALRTSLVMTADAGGVFEVLLGLVRKGLGGRNGDGKQFVSWMHGDDYAAAVERLIADEQFVGPVNLSSPHPLPNAEFMRELRRAVGVGIGLPAAKWMLELGAVFLKTETELILKSRRVTPGKLLKAGFDFRFPTWAEAAADLYARWRNRTSSR